MYFSAIASPQSHRKEYNTAESRPWIQIAIVTAKYTYLMSQHTEVTQYYLEFPEYREIKRMHKQ